MITPAQYPSLEKVESLVSKWLDLGDTSATDAIIKAAIDIERERVAKEAGEVVGYQYRYKLQAGGWSGWEPCDESGAKGRQQPQYRAKYETRALVVQNSAEDRADAERYRWLRSQPNDTSVPRIDVVHWVEDDESANAGTGLRLEALDSAIDAAIQSLTHPTETPR